MSSLFRFIQDRLSVLHKKVPFLRSIPFPSIQITLIVCLANVLIWIVSGIVLHFHPQLSSSAVLAYTLGLRHALDADHISAIDLTTRRLLASKRLDKHGNVKPVVSVGMWFSLGHSTIVIITTILVAATTAGITARFDSFSSVGGIIGSSVSTAFLLVLGAINAWLLWRGIANLMRVIHVERGPGRSPDVETRADRSSVVIMDKNIEEPQSLPVETNATPGQSTNANQEQNATLETRNPGIDDELKLRNRSCLNTLLRWVLKSINRPWKIYPLGVLFGLGFDTSSEIALLGLTTLESSRDVGNSQSDAGKLPASAIWAILIFPLLFTSGMCLLDTIDGAAMYALYTSRATGTSQLAIAYGNVILTGFTVFVALGVGILQMLNMLSNVLPQWRMDECPGFWDGVAAVGDRYDIVGGIICAGFVVVACAAWVGYKPWRKAVVEKKIDKI